MINPPCTDKPSLYNVLSLSLSLVLTLLHDFSRGQWNRIVRSGHLLHCCSIQAFRLKEEHWVFIFNGGQKKPFSLAGSTRNDNLQFVHTTESVCRTCGKMKASLVFRHSLLHMKKLNSSTHTLLIVLHNFMDGEGLARYEAS